MIVGSGADQSTERMSPLLIIDAEPAELAEPMFDVDRPPL